MRGFRMEHKVLGVFVLTFAALAVSAALVFITTRRLIQTADWVSHTYAVMEKIQGARTAALETSSSIYRYVITTQNLFLDRSESAIANFHADYLQLRNMTSDNPIEQQHLDQLAVALKAWESRIADVRNANQLEGFIAAQKLVKAQHISNSTTIFPIIDAMLEEEHQLLNTRLKEEHQRANAVNIVYVFLCILALIMFVIIYLQISHEIRMRRQTENKFQTLFQSAGDAIVLSDVHGKIVMVNSEAENMFGYSMEELISMAIDTLVPERTRAQHQLHRAGYIAKPQTRRMGVGLELLARRRDSSEFPVDISLSPLSTEDGMLVVSRIRDMTLRQNTENKIRDLNLHLEQRTKELETVNRELEAFSYSVSHDLRAPLRAIDGFSRLLQEHTSSGLDAEEQRLLAVVRENSSKMGKLIDALLGFSRLGRKPINGKLVGMHDLVEEALKEVLADLKNSRPTVGIGNLPDALGDRTLLKQVWFNLLSNAVKYAGKTPQPEIRIEGQGANKEIVYCVRDNGVGFDMRYAHKLFEVFQRLHAEEQFPGTGIGLATVKRIIVKHGGRVWAESKPGEGASFFFSLPNEGLQR